ncbi:hypothetical protein D3C86_1540980 [compost metagenome]
MKKEDLLLDEEYLLGYYFIRDYFASTHNGNHKHMGGKSLESYVEKSNNRSLQYGYSLTTKNKSSEWISKIVRNAAEIEIVKVVGAPRENIRY